jgi:hypothetical protein
MSSYNVTSKIHVWLGTTAASRASFARYFEVNPANREREVGASGFDQDLHTRWYDEDLIGVYYSEATSSLEAVLEEIPTSPATIEAIRARCAALGITQANALFYYEDAELIIAEPNKTYNGLPYVGSFDNA